MEAELRNQSDSEVSDHDAQQDVADDSEIESESEGRFSKQAKKAVRRRRRGGQVAKKAPTDNFLDMLSNYPDSIKSAVKEWLVSYGDNKLAAMKVLVEHIFLVRDDIAFLKMLI